MNGVISVYVQGKLVASWDGTNGSGTPVTNGTYYLTAQSIDPAGVVTTVTQTVTVSRTLSTVAVEVYNESGEVIRHLYETVVDSTEGSIQSVQLSASLIEPGSTSAGMPSSATIQVALPNNESFTVVWDGRDDSGNPVTNGQYFVEASWKGGPGDSAQVVTRDIAVENSGRSLAGGKVYALPNILQGGQAETVFRIDSASNLTLKVKLYDTAGERVASFDGPAGSNEAAFDAARLASGFYIALVELDDAAGPVEHQTAHLVIKR